MSIKEIPFLDKEALSRQGITFAETPLAYFLEGMHQHGDIFYAQVGIKKTLIVCHPELIHEISKDDKRYGLGDSNRIFTALLGKNSSATSDGAIWKMHNKATRQAFTQKEVAQFLTVLEADYAQIIQQWAGEEHINLVGKLKQLMAHTMLKYLKHENPVHEELVNYIYEEFIEKLLAKSRNPYSREARSREDKENFIDVSRKYRALIAELVANADNPMVVNYQQNNIEIQYLQDQLAGLLMLGTGSVAAALDSVMVLLHKNLIYKERVKAEIQNNFRSITDLPTLKLLHNVIHETYRLMPPAWMIFRKTTEDVQIREYTVPANTEVLLNFYAMNYNPTVWENPATFEPERFDRLSPEQTKAQFLPYGSGKRACLGANLAFQEICLFLAMFYKEYDITLENDNLAVVPRLSLLYEHHEVTIVKK
ncbi:MAG: cytochrome P450 [Bacteroidetes bacterium]|nr:MAG: cytochrome P450 [Bacteroidota bacterium]